MKGPTVSGLPSASRPAALGSLVALCAQALFAVFLLRGFEAQAVGTFSVISQLAFFWSTLALSQSPLSLLAQRSLPVALAARQAWRASMVRWFCLSPLILAGLWWSGLGSTDLALLLTGLIWLTLMSGCQLSWQLAQSLVLRSRSHAALAWVRMAPALLGVLVAAGALMVLQQPGANVLLASATLGFAVGALWLLPAWSGRDSLPPGQADSPSAPEDRTADDRPVWLKSLHTFSDVGVLTLMAVCWQAQHGSTAAGHLLLLLRLTGFVPALVHSAWSQVALASSLEGGSAARRASLLGCLLLGLLGGAVALAEATGQIAAGWNGLRHLLPPVLAWQLGATLLAALAHRPFQCQRARSWSWCNISLNALMTLLVLWPFPSALLHLQWLGYASATGHLLVWLWLLRLPGKPVARSQA
jgi:hypothetical protein